MRQNAGSAEPIIAAHDPAVFERFEVVSDRIKSDSAARRGKRIAANRLSEALRFHPGRTTVHPSSASVGNIRPGKRSGSRQKWYAAR
jgi:hypothetical protein